MKPVELRNALEQIVCEECNITAGYDQHSEPITPLEREGIWQRIERLFENWRAK